MPKNEHKIEAKKIKQEQNAFEKSKALKIKKELMELKIRNQQEIALARKELRGNIENVKLEIAKSKTEQSALKVKIKQELLKEKQVARQNLISSNAEIKKQLTNITENKKLLADENRQNRETIRLETNKQKNALLSVKKENREQIMSLKTQIKADRQAAKVKLIEVRQESQQRATKSRNELLEKKNKLREVEIEQKKFISKKRGEILDKKRELNQARLDARIEARQRRQSKIEQSRAAALELKQKRVELKQEFSGKIASIKEQEMIQKSKIKLQIDEAIEAKQKLKQELQDDVVQARAEIEEIKIEKQAEINEAKMESAERISEAKIDNHKEIEEYKFELEYNDDDEVVESNEVIRGDLITGLGKTDFKKYQKINKTSSTLNIDKLKINSIDLSATKAFEELNADNQMMNVEEFAKYLSFLYDKEIDNSDVVVKVASIIIPLLRGKVFSFINGYFTIEKYKGFKFVKYSKHLTSPTYNIISLPEEPLFKTFEEMVIDKLNKNGVIKITNNVAIRKGENDYEVLNGLAFIK